ncbi:MAG TPA: leucine-rich repeat protein [Firmicutes bacterium]|nr:leucine-rich repeat protein [Bacillota bacterium]
MKKHFIVVLSITMCLVLSVGILTACGTETDEPQKHTISFYADTSLVDTIETAGNEEITLPAAPRKEGCTFEGWFFDNGTWENELTKDSFADRALTGDVNAYAYYKENETPVPPSPTEYTITFYADGSVGDTLETAGNEILTLPDAPKKDNYTFEGWFFDNGTWQNRLTANTYADKPLTEDVSVYAYYKKIEEPEPEPPQEYTVRFDTDGGTAVNDMTVSVIEESPVTTKAGYTFAGWYKDSGFTDKAAFPYEVTKAQTLYAKWEKNAYTVRFDTDGGTAVSDMTVSVIEESPVTTKAGYTFAGWYKDSGLTDKAAFPYEVTKAQTLYAKWEKNAPEGIVFSVDGNGVLTGVSGLTESGMTVEIPSEINGITVAEIGNEVFADNTNIGRLVIPDSVTRLGYRMCSGCTALREVRLPSGLTVIPDEAFDGCSSLQTVNFPGTLKEIRSDAFCGTALTEFVAPDSLTDIWGYAFKDCADLAKVDLKNVRDLGSGAFQNCTALQSVRLADKMTGLSDHIFDGCASLAEIDMPDNPIAVSFTMLDGTAYYNDPSNWENGVLYADGYLIKADKNFASLTEYAVKEGTVVIADNAFSLVGYSAKLKKMTLPDGLYRIGRSAFSKLSSLTDINIPDSVRSIGYAAFEVTGFDTESNYTDGGLYIGNWLVAVENVAMTSFTVREGTIGVADGKDTSLFPTRAQKASQLSLPSSLRYIGARSFARLKISDLKLPSGLMTLGEGAFKICSYLKTVNLGDCRQLQSIGSEAFSDAALSEITIPENVVSVGELAFNQNKVNLTIRCEASEKPDGWDRNWSYTYNTKASITVEWGNV